MAKLERSCWVGPLASALLVFLVVCQYNFYASWLAYVPVFMATLHARPKQAFLKGLLWGALLSVIALCWMVPGTKRFTGHGTALALGVFVAATVLLSVYHACLLGSYAILKMKHPSRYAIWANSLLMASVFCMGESLLVTLAKGCPWFHEHAGSGLTANLYSIQPAAFLGIYGLSFAVVFVNSLTAFYVRAGQYTKLYRPAALVLLYLLTGVLLHGRFRAPANQPAFSVAIIAENIPPEVKWDSTTGNMLVQRMLDLNRAAVKQGPNMVLWSESGIPWMYSKDDELVKEVLKVTAPAQATHILGINTASGNQLNGFHNSAYCLLPDGQVTGRYDKQFMLSFVEQPIHGIAMPFLSNNGYVEQSSPAYAAPLPTPYGKAGVLICNEAAVSAAGANMARQGARFLLNMSNDGWFNDTYIVDDHFYEARLRAVETRKDMAVNSNNGYSGLIRASGSIEAMRRDTEPFVEMVSVQPNGILTCATACPHLLVYACMGYVLLVLAAGIYFPRCVEAG